MAINHNILYDDFYNILQDIDYLGLKFAIFRSLPLDGKKSLYDQNKLPRMNWNILKKREKGQMMKKSYQ